LKTTNRKIHRTDDKRGAQQHFLQETDINHLVKRFLKTGNLGTIGQSMAPVYGVCTSADFQTMQNTIIDAQNAFMQLPPRIRRRFGNDPYQLLRFAEDAKNKDEAIKLGILPEPPPEAPTPPKPAEKPEIDDEAQPHKKPKKGD